MGLSGICDGGCQSRFEGVSLRSRLLLRCSSSTGAGTHFRAAGSFVPFSWFAGLFDVEFGHLKVVRGGNAELFDDERVTVGCRSRVPNMDVAQAADAYASCEARHGQGSGSQRFSALRQSGRPAERRDIMDEGSWAVLPTSCALAASGV